MIFLGWEGLGLTSLLLIGFFNTDYSLSSTLKTGLINRVGDVFLFSSGLFCLSFSSSWVCFFFILLSAFVKSAQFPLFSWLPSAMAAPTPVSALVHSSTLVTAGLWLLFSSCISSFFFVVLGFFSAFFGGFIAVWDCDLKKVVAFSTISQLGFMFVCLSLFIVEFSFFYLLSHAFFKRLLFIGVGFLILSSSHAQAFGIIYINSSPAFWLLCFVSLFAISGAPFFSGFFVKHELSSLIAEYSDFAWGIFFMLSLVSAFYRFRLFF